MPGEDDPAAPMEKIHTLPFNPPVFDWRASNLYTKKNTKDAKVGAMLNWMGDCAFEIINDFVWTNPDDRKIILKC